MQKILCQWIGSSNQSDSEKTSINSPEDIYYQINAHLKQLRHEVQILALRKLARKPYKPLANEYQAIYQTFAKLSEKAAANMKTKDDKGKTSDAKMSGDEKNKDTEEKKRKVNASNFFIQNLNYLLKILILKSWIDLLLIAIKKIVTKKIVETAKLSKTIILKKQN